MNERIRELAEQAGFSVYEDGWIEGCVKAVEHLEKLIRADEREACAKLCDEKAKRDFNWASENADKYHAQASWAELCARAIRRRGEK